MSIEPPPAASASLFRPRSAPAAPERASHMLYAAIHGMLTMLSACAVIVNPARRHAAGMAYRQREEGKGSSAARYEILQVAGEAETYQDYTRGTR